MPTRRPCTLLIVALALAFGAPALTEPARAAPFSRCDVPPPPVPGEIVIGYTDQTTLDAVEALPLVSITRSTPFYALVGLSPTLANLDLLRGVPGVRFAHPNTRSCISAVPNDPLVAGMWSVSTPNGAGLASAWDLASAGNVIVAVIDTGIQLDHPDLAAGLWRNPREAPNGADDDRNGFVDDVRGVDLVARRGEGGDDQGHGTSVAGLIGARANNGIGIAGIAWDSRLMAVKVMDAQGLGTSTAIADGMRYAMANGARILNLSVNGDAPDQVQREAIATAQQSGAIVVASAGNEGRDIDAQPSYPASFAEPAIVGVGASAQNGSLSLFSNRGPGAVELAAPGEEVISTQRGGGYGPGSGTSFAAPHVAGVLALLAGARPELDAGALIGLLNAGARPAAGLPVGVGRLDAAGALARALPERAAALGRSGGPAGGGTTTPGRATTPGAGSDGGSSGGPGTSNMGGITVRLAGTTRPRAGRRTLRWTVRGAALASARRVTIAVDGRTVLRRRVTPRGGTLNVRAKVRLRRGTRRIRLRALDAAGRTVGSQTVRLRVRAAR